MRQLVRELLHRISRTTKSVSGFIEPTSLKMSLMDNDYDGTAATLDGAETGAQRKQLRAKHVPVLTRSRMETRLPRTGCVCICLVVYGPLV